MNKKMVIIGAGWLGDALAQYALNANWQVQATHRQAGEYDYERVFTLDSEQQLTHSVSLEDAFWVCAMSPGMRRGPSNYQQSLEHALALAHSMRAQGFVLCSSTGIYDNDSGHFDERSTLALTSTRQQRLHQAEHVALQAGAKVLRLGGLVGPDREPGRFVSGKVLSSHADDPVNMVHRNDVIAATMTLFNHYERGADIYNLVHPSHPRKEEYYQDHCQRQGSEVPTFSAHSATKRVIDGSAIEGLGFRYQHPI